MKSLEEALAEIQERKRRLWGKILASEPPGRRPGRRPRDPAQEALLVARDRRALARRETCGGDGFK